MYSLYASRLDCEGVAKRIEGSVLCNLVIFNVKKYEGKLKRIQDKPHINISKRYKQCKNIKKYRLCLRSYL